MILFPGRLEIERCEAFLEKAIARGKNDKVVLPILTSKHAFGGLASAIQAGITWLRRCPSGELIVGHGRLRTAAEEIARRPHKMAMAMMAASISTPEGQDVRRSAYDKVRQAVEKQSTSKYGAHLGGLCWFCFIDHSTKGFDPRFYRKDSEFAVPAPRGLHQIQSVIRAMVEKSLAVSGGSRRIGDEAIDNLGRLFYELFLNTHEHGSREARKSNWIKPGVRMVYTSAVNLADSSTKSTLVGVPVLRSYFQAVKRAAPTDSRRRFVEISIVDSGLGFHDRWLADHGMRNNKCDIIDEYEVFRKCFTFRGTSSGDLTKGHGLAVVMDRLTKLRGFIRVRTGRLALFRDFVKHPYRKNDECAFFDWSSEMAASENATAMPRAEGVAITLLVPLGEKQ